MSTTVKTYSDGTLTFNTPFLSGANASSYWKHKRMINGQMQIADMRTHSLFTTHFNNITECEIRGKAALTRQLHYLNHPPASTSEQAVLDSEDLFMILHYADLCHQLFKITAKLVQSVVNRHTEENRLVLANHVLMQDNLGFGIIIGIVTLATEMLKRGKIQLYFILVMRRTTVSVRSALYRAIAFGDMVIVRSLTESGHIQRHLSTADHLAELMKCIWENTCHNDHKCRYLTAQHLTERMERCMKVLDYLFDTVGICATLGDSTQELTEKVLLYMLKFMSEEHTVCFFSKFQQHMMLDLVNTRFKNNPLLTQVLCELLIPFDNRYRIVSFLLTHYFQEGDLNGCVNARGLDPLQIVLEDLEGDCMVHSNIFTVIRQLVERGVALNTLHGTERSWIRLLKFYPYDVISPVIAGRDCIIEDFMIGSYKGARLCHTWWNNNKHHLLYLKKQAKAALAAPRATKRGRVASSSEEKKKNSKRVCKE